MWRPRTSPASTRVIASTAALLAAEAASTIGNVEPTAEPARLTIVPPSRRCRAACRLTRNVRRTLVRCKASNLSRSWSATGPRMTWPAAWTRMSMPPKASVVSTNIRSTSSSSATSARDRERGPACGEDLLDDAVGRTLVPDVADDNGVAPVRELAHDLPADTPRAAGDDRDAVSADGVVVVRDQAVRLGRDRRPSHQGTPGCHPWSLAFRSEWPLSARLHSGAGRASGKCWTGCWRMSAGARAGSWSSGVRRGWGRKCSCATSPRRRGGFWGAPTGGGGGGRGWLS